MILPRFELLEPASVKEACDILQKNARARIIAGGTDLLVSLKKKEANADLVVSLAGIKELNKLSFSSRTGLSLGSMVSIAEIESSPVVRENYPILSNACGKLGSAQIRNRATVGGNICSARPAGDTIGALIALQAVVKIASASGFREETIESIFKGPGLTTIGKNEILTGIVVKKPAVHTGSNYTKYAVRNAMEIAMVSVTSLISIEKGVCMSAKIVLGAVGPTFVQCPSAEKYLIGNSISESVAEKAGQLALEAAHLRNSQRASAEYRRSIIQVLVKRSLLAAAMEVKSN